MRMGVVAARNRGSIFLLAMVALITLVILGVALMEIAVNGLDRASKDKKRAQAFALAESGVDMALAKLYDNYDNINDALASAGSYTSSFTVPQGTVNYTVTAPYNGLTNTCEIFSTSTTWAGKEETIRVVACYVDDPSRVFEGAIFSDSPIRLNGSGSIRPDASGNGASIYANGDISFQGTSFTMDYAGLTRGQLFATGTTNWVPDEVPATAVYEHIAPVPMPVIDTNRYKDMAQNPGNYGPDYAGVYYSGNKTLSSSDMDYDTLYPGKTVVVFVSGNLKLKGSYSGNVIMVATGAIDITGNLSAVDSATDSLAVLSPKSVKIAGNATVEGLVYAHGVITDASVTGSGNITVIGAICADVVTTNGGITVVYSSCWDGLPIPGTGKSQWAQVSWEELFL